VRGLVRSLHGNFGFEPQNAMLADTELTLGGYSGEKVPEMQKRMVDALEAIPGVEAVGLSDWTPLGADADSKDALVFTDKAADLRPAMFLPILQSPSSETWFIVRSGRDPQQLAAAIRSKLRDVDAGLPFIIGTWNQELDLTFFGPRMAASSLGVLGVLGAMLSITGIFGMAAYSVSKRKRELGIRIALGAQRKEVVQAALGRAIKLLAFGSAAGLLLGILASR